MPSDIVFKRSVFGGFDRDDVMAYIGAMKKREAELTRSLESFGKANETLKNELGESNRLIKSLKNTVSALKKEYGEKIDALKAQNEEKEKRLSDDKRISEEDLRKLKDDYELKISCLALEADGLRKKIKILEESRVPEAENVKKECGEKLENENAVSLCENEEIVGRAMLDVRRYANLLIKEICDKIYEASDSADEAVEFAISKLNVVSSKIDEFSEKVSSSLELISKEEHDILEYLNAFKGSLKTPFDEAAGKMKNEIFNGI